jgi:lipopolysaccharide export LptBFGC system permease protein LptF
MSSKTEIKGLPAFLVVVLYFLISVVGLRYGILLGFDKDIGIISPIILVFTFHWLFLVHLSGRK